MNNQNEEIDEMIKNALSKDEAQYYDNLNEQSLLEMIGGLFKGKYKWFGVGNVIVSLVFIGLGVYCLLNFLNVENTNEMIRWGAGLFGCALMSSMLKIWSWLQLNTNALKREIKRLELLVANSIKE